MGKHTHQEPTAASPDEPHTITSDPAPTLVIPLPALQPPTIMVPDCEPAVTPDAGHSHGWTPDRPALYAAQDDCLIAIEDNRPLPTAALKQLPPWRAVMIARLAARCGVGLETGTVAQLTASAMALGGSAVLDDWWVRCPSV